MSVHKRKQDGGQRWEVRWRQAGGQRKQRFATRTAAEAFDAKRRVDPQAVERPAQLLVQEMVAAYLAGVAGLRPKTQDAYRYDAGQVTATFGDRLAAGVRTSEVRTWVARPDVSATVRRRSLQLMRRCYRLAMADRLLTLNPCDGVASPKVRASEMQFLTWSQLEALAEAAGDFAPLVWLLGTTGLRLGEALALDQADVDRGRRRIRVRRSWSVSSSGRELGPTKGSKAREVPVTTSVLAVLPTDRIGPLFVGARGGRLDPHSWRTRVFRPAARAAGLGEMHPHELRHTAASLAIASGADVKAVQRMLGHSSAAMTLDLYGHLWDAQLDTVADRMEESRRAHEGRTVQREGASGALTVHNSNQLNSTPGSGRASSVLPLTRANGS